MNAPVLDLVIDRRRTEADGIISLDLRAPDGGDLPPFEAGAHVDVHVEGDLVRQYSLCGAPSDRSRYRLGILRDPASRGGSARIHDAFDVGRTVRIGMPRNHFAMQADAPFSVLVGGGIGITPILAMARQLHEAGAPFVLHYAARSNAQAAFLAELREAPFAAHVNIHLDDGGDAQLFVPDAALPQPPVGAHLYVCGPTGFMDWVIARATACGYPDARIHREYFSAEVDATGDAFDIVLAASDRTVHVARGTSIVKALANAGVHIEVSCEQGVCGTCLCNVLDGEPDHRDVYLTQEEKDANDQMLLCCSRAKTPRLVLDL